jgi:Holliday junction DNA helicase RuvB
LTEDGRRPARAVTGAGRQSRDVTPVVREDRERSLEATLRPQRLSDDEYINQDKVKGQLRVLIEAAKGRGEPLDHVALHGPPGVGKTSLANVIAHELGVPIRVTSGPAIERAGDLAAILTALQPGEVLFIDEVHRLPRLVEEILYPAMDVYQLDIVIGKGPGARTLRLPLPRFTLVGATTRIGRLSSPLRDRFGATYKLDLFETDALEKVVRRSARILSVEIEAAAAHEIARRSRGTPRIANRWLKRVRDFAQVRHDGRVTLAVAREALAALEVDDQGLDDVDRKLLAAIIDKFSGGPVGLDTLAAALSEDTETIEDVYEPYLMQEGYLKRTSRGRVVTEHAYRHLGRTPPSGATLWNGAHPDDGSRPEK